MVKYGCILGLLLLPWLSCGPHEPVNCRAARIDSRHQINGIISEKYVTDNQRYQVLEIKQFVTEDYHFSLPKGRHLDFFEYVSVNDTVQKDSNSLTYYIKKPSGEVQSFFLHHDCPDSLSLPR